MCLSNTLRSAPTRSMHSERPSNQTRTRTSSMSTTIFPTLYAITRTSRRARWWRTRKSALACASLRSAPLRASCTSTFVGRLYTVLVAEFNSGTGKAEGTSIQVMCQIDNAKGDVEFEKQHENIQRGDIIGVIGFPGRTNPKKGGEGELSIFAREVILLTPCLRMLPTEHL